MNKIRLAIPLLCTIIGLAALESSGVPIDLPLPDPAADTFTEVTATGEPAGNHSSLSRAPFDTPGNSTQLSTDLILQGDLDGDNWVGIVDLNIVLGNWNLTVPPGDPRADVAGGPLGGPDGFVGIVDLNVVLTDWNMGTPPGGEASASVPEPSTAVVSLTAVLGALMIRVRRVHG